MIENNLIFEWFEKADHDLGSAIVIYHNLPKYHDTICFHCQQATEKYIKGVLFANSIKFKRKHDLAYF